MVTCSKDERSGSGVVYMVTCLKGERSGSDVVYMITCLKTTLLHLKLKTIILFANTDQHKTTKMNRLRKWSETEPGMLRQNTNIFWEILTKDIYVDYLRRKDAPDCENNETPY